MNKKANVVATILIVSALLVTSVILVQRELYPSQSSQLERTQNAFARNVYESPADLIEAYSQNGYQLEKNGWWYCADQPSPPDLAKTLDDFTLFAGDELADRLSALADEFPNLNARVSDPTFILVGDPTDIDTQLDERVEINVTNFTLTIEDGDRLVTTSYNQRTAYDLRFWLMYKVLRAWIGCDNGRIFDAIDTVLQRRECAFFKDMCFCAQHEWTFCEPGDVPGIDCNPCPCGRKGAGLPLWSEEVCDPDAAPTELQDFTSSERQEIIREYGIDESQLYGIGEAIADEVNKAFSGDSVCDSVRDYAPIDTNIRCEATVSNPQIQNRFISSYVYHPTGCLEQVDGTCGWVPVSTYNSLSCARAPMCPPNSVLGDPDRIQQILQDIEAGVYAENRCENVTVEDAQGNEYSVIQCDDVVIGGGDICVINGEGDEVCTQSNDVDDCSYTETFQDANQGNTGIDPGYTSTMICNPIPTGDDPGPGDIAADSLLGGSEKYKCIEPDSLWWGGGKDGRYFWFGMNGWLDRRGVLDLKITCTDPGTPSTLPLQASISMRVTFRHGCDTSQAQMRAWAPPACRLPGTGNQGGCNVENCKSSGCLNRWCDTDENGDKYCRTEPKPENSLCDSGSNPCFKNRCVYEEGQDFLSCVQTDEVNEGYACGTGSSQSCKVCQADGSCGNADDGTFCFLTTNQQCRTTRCVAGSCSVTNAPAGSTCDRSECGECVCVGSCDSLVSGDCSPQYTPQDDWCSGDGYYYNCNEWYEPSWSCQGNPSSGYACIDSGNPPPPNNNNCCGTLGDATICTSHCCPGTNVCVSEPSGCVGA